MERPVGTPYRRGSWETLYYAVFSALWTGMALFFLLWYGRSSGWFFVAGGFFAYGAVQSRRLPYAVINAAAITVWRSPFSSKTIAWQDVVAARRIGQRIRIELPQRKSMDVRWDGVARDDRERFLRDFAARLDSRWGDDPGDTRADTWRQILLVVVLMVVLAAILAYRTRLIEVLARVS